jgi:hypothetical protein
MIVKYFSEKNLIMAIDSNPYNQDNWELVGFPSDEHDFETPYVYVWQGKGSAPAGAKRVKVKQGGVRPWDMIFTIGRIYPKG